jgi:polysaccharide pyruvyl transferase CsaB
MKIIICGNYGATNIGDEMILAGILNILKPLKAEITVLSNDPAKTEQEHGIKSVNLIPSGFRSFFKGLWTGRIWKSFNEISDCDLFILGGGGLLTDEKPFAIIIWSIQALVARFYKKRVFCFAQSIGPLKTFFGKFMTKRILLKSKIVTVRDYGSYELTNKMGIKNALTLADPAFALDLYDGDNRDDDYVLFTIRPWIKGDTDKIYADLKVLVDFIWTTYGLKSVFVPFQAYKDDDRKEMDKLKSIMETDSHVTFLKYSHDIKDIFQVFHMAKFVVGMRLHSLIMSALAGKPMIALSYSNKVKDFMHTIDMNNYVIEFDQFNAEAGQNKVTRLMDEYSHLQNIISEKVDYMNMKANEHLDLIKEITS